MDEARSLTYSISVRADTSQAESNIRGFVSGLGNVSVGIRADTSKAEGDLRSLADSIGSLGNATVSIDADTQNAESDVASLADSVSSLGGTTVDINADTANAQADVEHLADAVGSLGNATIDISADTRNAEADVEHLADVVGSIGGATVDISADTANAQAEVERLADTVSGLGGATIDISADTSSAQTALDSLMDGARNARTEIDALSASAANAQAALDGLGKASEESGKKTDGFGSIIKGVGVALAAATTAVGGFVASSVNVGMSFDSSMSQVAATMGMTMEQMNTQVGSVDTAFGQFEGTLRDFAQFMGQNTAFSASQAADALNYMALAGYDAETSMAMLPNVLNLAAAGGIELATASDMVTDAQSALGLSLEETAEMVDKMAAASSKSNTSVAQLGQAFLTIGGTAKNLSGGTTELATALGILADNGIKGAEGGTALRNVVLSLSAPTDKAAAALANLGVDAFDAEGNLRPLGETFESVTAAMDGMSTQERQNILSDIFNKVDLKSVSALMAAAVTDTGEMVEALGSAGIAWDKYADSAWMAGGGIESLTSEIVFNMKTLGASAEEIQDYLHFEYDLDYEDAARAVETVGGLVENCGNRFDELSAAITGAWYSTGSLSEQLSGVGLDLATMQSNLAELGVSAETFSSILAESGGNGDLFADMLWEAADAGVSFEDITAALGGDLEALGAAFDATTGAAQQMADTQLDNLAGDITRFQSALEAAQIKISDQLTPTLREFTEFGTSAIMEITDAFSEGGLSGAMGALGNVLSEGLGMVIEELPSLVDAGTQLLGALGQGILDNLPLLVGAASQIIVTLATGISDALPTLIPSVAETVTLVFDTLIENAPLLIDAGLSLIEGLGTGLIDAIPVLVGKLPQIITGIIGAITGNIPRIVETGITLITALVQNIPAIVSGIVAALPQIITGIIDGLVTATPLLVQAGITLFTSLVQNIPAIVAGIVEHLPEIVSAIVGGLGALGGMLADLFTEAWEGVKAVFSGVGEFFTGIWEGISGVFSSVGSWFSDRFSEAKQGVENAFSSIGNWFSDRWSDITGVFASVGNWFSDRFTEAKKGVESAFSSIGNWFSDRWSDVTDALSDVGSWFSETFTEASENVHGIWEDVGGWFSDRWDDITDAFSDTASWFSQTFTDANNFAQDAWSAVGSWFSDRWSDIQTAFASTGQWFSDTFIGANSNAQAAFSNIGNWFSDRWNDITSALSNVGSWFLDTFTQANSNLESAFSGIGTFFSGVWSDITGVFSDAWNEFLNIGSNIVGGITQGISDAWNGLTSWVSEKFSGLVGGVKKTLGIQSPSKVFREQIGENIALGVAEGIADKSDEAVKAADDMAKDVYSRSKTWADRQTKYQEYTLAEQIELWETIQSQFIEGSKQYADAEDKLFDLRKKAAAEAAKEEQEACSARTKILEQQKATEEGIVADIGAVWKSISGIEENYQKELESRTQEIFNTYKLFDAVPEQQKINGQDLIANLRGQVTAIGSFYDNLGELAERGVGEDLIEEIRALGPKASGELSALLSLSDEELSEYAGLYAEKQRLANEIATEELSELRDESDRLIRENMDSLGEIIGTAVEESETWGADLIQNFIAGIEGMEGDLGTAISRVAQIIGGAASVPEIGLTAADEPQTGEETDVLSVIPTMRSLAEQAQILASMGDLAGAKEHMAEGLFANIAPGIKQLFQAKVEAAQKTELEPESEPEPPSIFDVMPGLRELVELVGNIASLETPPDATYGIEPVVTPPDMSAVTAPDVSYGVNPVVSGVELPTVPDVSYGVNPVLGTPPEDSGAMPPKPEELGTYIVGVTPEIIDLIKRSADITDVNPPELVSPTAVTSGDLLGDFYGPETVEVSGPSMDDADSTTSAEAPAAIQPQQADSGETYTPPPVTITININGSVSDENVGRLTDEIIEELRRLHEELHAESLERMAYKNHYPFG